MEIWIFWLDVLRGFLELLSSNVGLGAGLSIVAATLLLRLALLPISWPIAYQARIRQKKLLRLQPELLQLKERLKERPELYPEQMLALYRKHGLAPIDGRSILGGLAQLPVFLGMFHVLRDGIGNGRFLWIDNLSRPDGLLAIAAGVTTALMIAVIPDLPEHLSTFMLLVPSVIVILVAFKFSSALCLYWTASNCFTTAQTLLLNRVVDRGIRSGRLSV